MRHRKQKNENEQERKFKLEQDKMKYEHELAMQKAIHEQSDKLRDGMNPFSKVPKLPIFQDENDNIDAYLV